MNFTIQLTQPDQNSKNNPPRQLDLTLTSRRVVQPVLPNSPTRSTIWDPKYNWIATNVEYHFWGLWWPGYNNITNAKDKSIGHAPPEDTGWRLSLTNMQLEFVERWQMTGGTEEIKVVARLYEAVPAPGGGFAPRGSRHGTGNGVLLMGSNIFMNNSTLNWEYNP